MNPKNLIFWCFLLFCLPKLGFTQINIDLPIEKSVFQRDSVNRTKIEIRGSYDDPIITSVQARLVNPTTGAPISGFNWRLIDTAPSLGHFSGRLNNVPAGWYKLEVRSIKTGAVVSTGSVNAVGIGDVFLVAGQSNAQGQPQTAATGLGSNDPLERVVSHNFNDICTALVPEFPSLSKIQNNNGISINADGPWCYGALGDQIVNTTGFPVAFYNVGAGGSSAENWEASSNGNGTIHNYFNQQVCLDGSGNPFNSSNPTGIPSPYLAFDLASHYYNSIFGARAVLWHQGETDSDIGTTTANYTSRLNSLIAKSRTDLGYNIPWVISQVSYIYGSTASAVIAGQAALVNPSNQIFLGPNTDILDSTYRYDNLHFSQTTGLQQLANLWSAKLDSSFFANSKSIAAKKVPTVTISRSGANVVLKVDQTFSSYKWVGGSANQNYSSTTLGTNNTFTANSGTYRCYVKDSNGNIQVTQAFNIDDINANFTNNSTCSGQAFLSDLIPSSIKNGLGPIELNRSNGGAQDGDGAIMFTNNIQYAKGVGVFAPSELIYDLDPNKYKKFQANVGIASESTNSTNKVVFKVYGDGNILYQSPIITKNTSVISIDVNIRNISQLKLVVDPSSDGNTNDIANWSDAKLTCYIPDTTPPTVPGNLMAENVTKTCFDISWDASTDNEGVDNYLIYLNNTLVATLANNVYTYSFTNLTNNTNYTYKVIAKDLSGNLSTAATDNVTTGDVTLTYNSNNMVCLNTPTLPTVSQPGGKYYITSGTGATINLNTGQFSSTVKGSFIIKYTITSDAGCVLNKYVTIQVFDLSNFAVSPSPVTANSGSSVTLTASGCTGGSVNWSTGQTNTNTITITPTATTSVTATCTNTSCPNKSVSVPINIVPNCASNVIKQSTADDYNFSGYTLEIKSSNTIKATNKIQGTSEVDYKAGNYILLNPGFKSDANTVFTAEIIGCP